MSASLSKIADNRKSGKHQAEELRARILETAEALFLERGIESTAMGDIASRLGVSRVTIYRYFANRDEIAVEVQVRMLEKINSIPPLAEGAPTLESYRSGVRAILRSYASLREAYRYIGMFDALYLDRASDNALTRWTIAQLLKSSLGQQAEHGSLARQQAYGNKLGIILDTLTWVLEKLALRGDFTLADPAVGMEKNLEFFETMIFSALDLLEDEEPQG